MDGSLAAHLWAQEEFGHLEAGDPRHTKRLIAIGSAVLMRPAGRVTRVFRRAAERKGAYTFLSSKLVSAQDVLRSSGRACAERAALCQRVLVPLDGSSLSLHDGTGQKGFGRLGSSDKARGIKVISAIGLSACRQPLGLLAQSYWARPKKKRKKQHAKLPVAQKETQRWLDVIDQVDAHLCQHAPQTECVFIVDREGDCWAILTHLAEKRRSFVIRSAHDRIAINEHGTQLKLRALVAKARMRLKLRVHVPQGPKRRERQALLHIRAATVLLPLQETWSKKRHPQALNVVWVHEVHTTPRGEKPLDWLLLTNLPIETDEQIEQVIEAYRARWAIESFHKTWKSGGMQIEQTQLRHFDRVTKWAAITAATAMKAEQLKQRARTEPEAPSSEELTLYELNALMYLKDREKKRTEKVPRRVPTMVQAALWMAHLGGYVDQKSPPGTITIGRGMARVQDVAATFEGLGLTPMLSREAYEKARRARGTG